MTNDGNEIMKEYDDVSSIFDFNKLYSSEKSILTSSDGIKFVVSNQWGAYNFINFLDHIKGMGWIVTNISKKP